MKLTITIEYCPKCGWLLRASWMAQELLTTFSENLHGVLLQPSEVAGRYLVSVDGEVITDRKRDGGFTDIKVLKQLVRDKVAPGKNLGHSDKTNP